MARMDIISLILSLLASDDALRMEEISRATGIASAKLRPAMRKLVDDGVVVTSGRTRGTRYMIAVEEQTLTQDDLCSYAIGMTAQRASDEVAELAHDMRVIKHPVVRMKLAMHLAAAVARRDSVHRALHIA